MFLCRVTSVISVDMDLCPSFVQVIRKRIIEKGLRVDGRQLDEVRPLYCESSTYPILHGSALFSRGDTQVLSHTL
jgi:polyribonucleotide nucleotidyltransferase